MRRALPSAIRADFGQAFKRTGGVTFGGRVNMFAAFRLSRIFNIRGGRAEATRQCRQLGDRYGRPFMRAARRTRAGRLFDEDESGFRSPFQRDRDRIIHASAFPPPEAQDPSVRGT